MFKCYIMYEVYSMPVFWFCQAEMQTRCQSVLQAHSWILIKLMNAIGSLNERTSIHLEKTAVGAVKTSCLMILGLVHIIVYHECQCMTVIKIRRKLFKIIRFFITWLQPSLPDIYLTNSVSLFMYLINIWLEMNVFWRKVSSNGFI